jgi:hypothetical protein
MENEVVVEPESVRAVAAAPIVEVRDLRGLGGFIVDDIEEGEGVARWRGSEATGAPPRSRVAGRGRTHRGSRGGGRRRKKLTWGIGEGGVR